MAKTIQFYLKWKKRYSHSTYFYLRPWVDSGCGVQMQWCYWRKWIGWQKMHSTPWDVQWRSIVERVVSFCAVIHPRVSFQQYAVDVLLSGLLLQRMTRLNYCGLFGLCLWYSVSILWFSFSLVVFGHSYLICCLLYSTLDLAIILVI